MLQWVGFVVWLLYEEWFDISHLLFADDTLIFCGVTQITYIICYVCSYVLKLSWAWQSIWLIHNWFLSVL
jgi:hypothetical protein